MRELTAAHIARDTGLNLSTVKRIRSGWVQPSPRSEALFRRYAAAHARRQLGSFGGNARVGRNDIDACAHYIVVQGAVREHRER